MLKFHTAAFGFKYETFADTFEVGSCCSWCTADRHLSNVTQPYSAVFGSLYGLVCVMMGIVVTMIVEDLDVIIVVWSVNYGKSYTHFSAVFCLYFNVGQRIST